MVRVIEVNAENRVFEFGPFRLIPRTRMLLRAGEPVELGPKALEILLTLVENRGRSLTKDELMNAIWPGAAVEESSVGAKIFQLRKILNDDPARPRYVATVPEGGYRFIAQVAESHENLDAHGSAGNALLSLAGRYAGGPGNTSDRAETILETELSTH
jgi:DNA-binding winged helix-turn-helix (wHTH) protein